MLVYYSKLKRQRAEKTAWQSNSSLIVILYITKCNTITLTVLTVYYSLYTEVAFVVAVVCFAGGGV